MVEKPQSRASMTSTPGSSTERKDGGAGSDGVDERRRRVGLRRLVDEMLMEIRAAANEDNWTPNARQQAEHDLARIMEQVRAEAMRGNGPTAASRSGTSRGRTSGGAKSSGAKKASAARSARKSSGARGAGSKSATSARRGGKGSKRTGRTPRR